MSSRHLRRLAAGLAALLIGVLAGCGSSVGPGPAPASTTAPGRGRSLSTAVTSPSPGTITVPAETVTTVNGTTTTTNLPGATRPPILLGDLNTPEQFILGQLYDGALSAQGYTVALNRNIGPTSISQAALSQGSLDAYPEYLDVYDTQVVGDRRRFPSLAAAYAAGRAWASAHGQELLPPARFSDTAGIAVLASYARAHHLRSMADLRRVQNSLTLGSPLEFSTDPMGLPALEQAYRFSPALTTTITIGSQYTGLRIGTLQAAWVQTSDWQLTSPRYVSLPDIRHVLGYGNVVPVISDRAVAAEGPVFVSTIEQVDAMLSTPVMRGLVAEMEASPDPAQAASGVAQEFLQGQGILPPPPWATFTATTTVPSTSMTSTGSP